MGAMMAFDLLPEKHSHFKDYKLDIILIISILITPLCVLLIKYTIVLQQQSSLQERIQADQEELRAISMVHQSDDAAQHAEKSLQATRKLWEILGRSINDSVCISEMHRYKNKVTLSGKSQSIQNLQLLIDSITNAHLFKNITLARITDTKKQTLLEFSLHADEQDR